MIDLYELIEKINGKIEPIGETHIDNDRFENLQRLVKLVDKLIFDINEVAGLRDREQYSLKKAGKYAFDSLKEIQEALEDEEYRKNEE